MTTQAHVDTPFGGVAFAVIGLFLAPVGGLLFASHLPMAGYGILILVWGLAFLLSAYSRYEEWRA